MVTLEIKLLIGPTTFPILFQVLRIPTSFNLLLGRPWIHRAGAIPFSLHQKVKFIHNGQVITVQSVGDMFISSKSMSYLPGMGLGRRQHGPSEFMAIPDHDVPFEPGFIPIEADYRYMARLLKEMIDGMIQPKLASPFDLFKVSAIEVVEEIQTTPDPEFTEDDIVVDGLFDGPVSLVEGVSDFVEPLLSFDVLSGFVSHSNDVHDSSFMDLNDEIAQPDSDDDSSSAFDSDPLIREDGLARLLRLYLDVLHGPMRTCQALIHPQFSITYHFCPMPDHVGFLSMVEYPEWLANVIPIPKKDGKSYSDGSKGHGEDVLHYRVGVDHLVALERFFERIRQFKLKLNPKKCTFGMTFGKLLGYMVNERGTEADPDKIRVILDMLTPRIEREIRGFLGRLQYISRFIARLMDIYESIFRLLRKIQPTVWDNQCQCSFERIREYLLSPLVLVSPTPVTLYSYTWSSLVSDVALGCMLTRLDDSGKESLNLINGRAIDDDFPNEDVVVVTSHLGWPSMIDIPIDATVRPLLIESRFVPTYCCLIDEEEFDDGFPWYHDIYQFLRLDLASTNRVMREVHAGVCGPHMRRHMLAHKIMRTDYFWLTMKTTVAIWSIDIIGKISPKSSNGHEFILVVIDYFTKEVHFRANVDTLLQRYDIHRHRSFVYRPQTNGVVEVANKNIKRILRRMVETSRDWLEKLHFALWAYRTSFRTSTGATPYSFVYGIETEVEGSNYVHAYQRKMARAFKKRVKPRPLHRGDLVLKVIKGLIKDPRGKFRLNWSRHYFIRELTPKGAAWLMVLDGNRFSEPTNVDQLKRYYV
ncbi:Retrovirus-related Pol polyprotein from transposon 412 [Vitis vinifera]|uniref:Retrovirus-related Pol polyprotein from transposon 412 n=1 Tax=Vitis vinifera TaxID=29760 RepID=A0A438BZ50_VITVI|nr:Retrovirus-related Pol polyprotein from transposon 412 [Vitis vinifera]